MSHYSNRSSALEALITLAPELEPFVDRLTVVKNQHDYIELELDGIVHGLYRETIIAGQIPNTGLGRALGLAKTERPKADGGWLYGYVVRLATGECAIGTTTTPTGRLRSGYAGGEFLYMTPHAYPELKVRAVERQLRHTLCLDKSLVADGLPSGFLLESISPDDVDKAIAVWRSSLEGVDDDVPCA